MQSKSISRFLWLFLLWTALSLGTALPHAHADNYTVQFVSGDQPQTTTAGQTINGQGTTPTYIQVTLTDTTTAATVGSQPVTLTLNRPATAPGNAAKMTAQGGGTTVNGVGLIATTTTNGAGVATFHLSIDRADSGYTMTTGYPSAPGGSTVSSATSTPAFNISLGPATKLTVSSVNSPTTAGQLLTADGTQPVTVTATDAGGNVVPNVYITMGLLKKNGASAPVVNGVLQGTLSQQTNSSGSAAFSDLSINKAYGDGTTNVGYELQPSAAGITTGSNPNDLPSTVFQITADGSNVTLSFTAQPTNTTSNNPIDANLTPTGVKVLAVDPFNNPIAGLTVTMAISSGTGTSGATLTDASPDTPPVQTDSTGVATFAGLSIDKPGSGYALTALATGAAASSKSNLFAVTVGAAASLNFNDQPASSFARQPISGATPSGSQIQVKALDASSNPVPGVLVTLAIAPGTGTTGATLSGSVTQATDSTGVATFAGLSIDKAGAGYKLRPSASGVTPAPSAADSTAFNITYGTTITLAFTAQPTDTVSCQPVDGGFTPPGVKVQAIDQFGNSVPGVSVVPVITSGTGATGAVLSGSASQTTGSDGVATFTSLSIDKAGAGYSLTVSGTLTGSTVTGGVSNSFAVTAGGLASIAFTGQPNGTAAGQPINGPAGIVVHATDRTDGTGNPVAGTSVSIKLSSGTGILSGATTQVTNASGDAIFTGLSINLTGDKQLQAQAAGLLSAGSNTFNISTGSSVLLAFMAVPSTGKAGQSLAAVTVKATDTGGNVKTGVGLTLSLNRPATGNGIGAVLSQNDMAVQSVSGTTGSDGTATFTGLSIDKADAYSLHAADQNSPAQADSSQFTITADVVAFLSFTAQPVGAASEQPITGRDAGGNPTPGIVVHAQDAKGNPEPSGTQVTLSLNMGKDAAGNPVAGILSPASPSASTDANGNATFTGLSIDKAASYTLRATSGSVTTAAANPPTTNTGDPNVDSAQFAIKAGAAATLTFTIQPQSAVVNQMLASVKVQALDANNNIVPDGTSVTLALNQAQGGTAALGGTTTQATSGGIVTFSNLSVSATGTYTLTASSGSATPIPSGQFTISNPPVSIMNLTLPGGTVLVGGPTFNLLISGMGFTPGSTVTIIPFGGDPANAQPLPTGSVTISGSTSIVAQVPGGIGADSLIPTAGPATVIVSNPAGTGSSSGSAQFQVFPLGPTQTAAGTAHGASLGSNEYFDGGVQLFSVPYSYGSTARQETVLQGLSLSGILLTPLSARPLTLAEWDPTLVQYLMTPAAPPANAVDPNILTLGRAYWVRFPDPTTTPAGLIHRGQEAGQIPGLVIGGQFTIALKKGWNMIGDPFIRSVNLSNLQVQVVDAGGNAGSPVSLTAADQQGLLAATFFCYQNDPGGKPAYVVVTPGSSAGTMNPYVGYWAYAYTDCTLLVPQP